MGAAYYVLGGCWYSIYIRICCARYKVNSSHMSVVCVRRTEPSWAAALKRLHLLVGGAGEDTVERGGDLVIRQRFHQVTKKSINTQPFAMLSKFPIWFLFQGQYIVKRRGWLEVADTPNTLLRRNEGISLVEKMDYPAKAIEELRAAALFFFPDSRYMCVTCPSLPIDFSLDPTQLYVDNVKKSYLWQWERRGWGICTLRSGV